MKVWITRLVLAVGIVLLVMGWMVYFHNAMIGGHLPHWHWLQAAVGHLGQKAPEAAADDEDPDTTTNEIPIHTARISVTTLHRYIESLGAIVPRPSRNGEMAGSANIASPVAGIVAKVLCQAGQQVHAGDPLIQLDDRLAQLAEEQANASLSQAQASLDALKATPRPEQLEIARLAVNKSQTSLDFAQKTYDRLKQLAAQQGASAKSVEQSALDLSSAQNDLVVSQNQLALLKASPSPQELGQEQAKVAQANSALASARAQRQMMTITAPIDATVVSLSVNPGEGVDTTRTLVQLVSMDRLMVDLDVPADQLPANAQGLAAQVFLSPKTSVPSDDASVVMGKVAFVSPQVDPRNNTIMVGVDLAANALVRPGLSVRVRIITEEHKDCLAVPREAVVSDENGDSVIALVENDQATHKTVKAGLEENGLIEIEADGLKEGSLVATQGAYGLPPATRVKVVD